MREKYESLSLVVLRDLAKSRGIKNVSSAKKADIIELMLAEDEREKAEKKLLMKLQEAEEAVKDESAWMSLDELKKSVGV